jgi:trehalose 6-phosphate phosphatase
MKHLLAAESVDVLGQLAWSRVLLAFDFDGTLAPIVADRDLAEMRARTRALLATAARLYPCAVISGRARRDVAARLDGTAVKYVIGNHGMEPGTDLARYEREIARVRHALEQALASQPGVDIEDKRYSLAVHYRASRQKRAARVAISNAIASLPRPMRVIAGKLVANVLPIGAPTKGDVLLALRSRARADVALFVGDEVTDEDVFSIDQPGRLLSLRIGHSAGSSARYYLRDQREIDRLLARLVRLREHRRP